MRLNFANGWSWIVTLGVWGGVSLVIGATAVAQQVVKVTEIEGIAEYRLENGVQVLLFPDDSKPHFTINVTVLVGSRHEGYGETGMAHLLEHMLFKGTPSHRDIPKLLNDRGPLNLNGTTWYDRTNYFETLPSNDDNLEFAIRLEADRLVNSSILAEDLATEMTVVRNEFEMGENSPFNALWQRLMATAFEWHNYGKSTIGNRSDIERVPIENLRAFYQKYYQPDNIMVVLAGQFPQERALDLLQQYFGTLPVPERELPRTYTEEPVQDGERLCVVRRVGDVQLVGLCYHIPAASHPDFAAVEVLKSILGMEPAGRLYQRLVVGDLAARTFAMAFPCHDPGALLVFAEVSVDKDLEAARAAMIDEVERVGESGVTAEEVQRAVQSLLKAREELFANTASMAVNLSEWRACGDWRLFFYHRDQLEKVSPTDVQRVAQHYLLQSNRTVGLFIPTASPQRAPVHSAPNLRTLLADYRGRSAIAAGEEFDPSPENIDARTVVQRLSSGVQLAVLPRKTRGDRVFVSGELRYGSLHSLPGLVQACDILPELMSRGTANRTFQQVTDRLDALRTTIELSGGLGTLSFAMQTKDEHLDDALDLLRELLREPALSADELEILKRQRITALEQSLSEPQSLVMTEMQRLLQHYPPQDPRYVPTIAEEIERWRELTIEQVRGLYASQLQGSQGEVAIVGNVQPEAMAEKWTPILAGWTSDVPFEHIPRPAQDYAAPPPQRMVTPDKAGAVFAAGQTISLRDDDPQYASLLIGNHILGGGALSSRLADRVRKAEGLSYGVGSMFQADSIDERGVLMMFAISHPDNTPKVAECIAEEFERWRSSGVEQEELEKAKASYLQTRRSRRASEEQLVNLLRGNLKLGRTMAFHAQVDAQIEWLDKERVDRAIRDYFDPARNVVVTAGDFKANQED